MDVPMVITAAGDVVGLPCLILSACGVLAPWRTAGVFAVANGAAAVDEIAQGADAMFWFNAPVCVLCTWTWWKGGGGDGTKRRLRSLARVFRGVRRTAPVTGGAS